jgi:hypothetical protein
VIGTAPPEAPQDARTSKATYIRQTKHNIPWAFWDYFSQQSKVFDWVSTVGYPITEPYWSQIYIGNRYQWILFQAFQRRVLTFNPANSPNFRVEMGNVGLHYVDWRYPKSGAPVNKALTMAATGQAEICYASTERNCTTRWDRAFAYANGVSETGQVRTGSGKVDVQTRSAVFRLQDNALIQFKQITNSLEAFNHWSGHLFVAHDPAGRDVLNITTADGAYVDTTDSRFSILITDTATIGAPIALIAVPAEGGSVVVGLSSAQGGTISVKAGTQVVLHEGEVILPAPEPIDPAEQARWNQVLKEWHDEGVRTADLGRVPGPKLVTAFYYSWYLSQMFAPNYSGDHGRMFDHPLQPYDSNDPTVIERQIGQAQSAGIDAFISAWTGQGTETDQNFPLLLSTAERMGFQATIYVEVDSVLQQGPINTQLKRMLGNYSSRRGFLHWAGKPVLFFWKPSAYSDKVEDWSRLRRELDPDNKQIWSVDTTEPRWLEVFDSIHLFTAGKWNASTDVAPVDTFWRQTIDRYNREHDTHRLWTAGVIPGWDESRILPPRENARVVPRNSGAVYEDIWQKAIASQPDWITISSFNEWYEGSQIEPGHNYDYGDQYLDLTRKWSEVYRHTVPAADSRAPDTPPPSAGFVPSKWNFFTSANQGCNAVPSSTFTYGQRIYAQVELDSAPKGTLIEVVWNGGANFYERKDELRVSRDVKPACIDGFYFDAKASGGGPGTYVVTLLIDGRIYDSRSVQVGSP